MRFCKSMNPVFSASANACATAARSSGTNCVKTHRRRTSGAQHELARAASRVLGQQTFECPALARAEEPPDRLAQDAVPLHPDDGREPGIAVEHGAVGAERDRAFLHLLDQHAIGSVGIL